MGGAGGPGEAEGLPWGGLSGGGAKLPAGLPTPVSGTAELRASRQAPRENHKSQGYMRALSPSVFDRDTKFNFLQRALNPQPSPQGGCGHPRYPPPRHPHPFLPWGSPRAPHHGMAAGLQGQGGSFGEPRMSPEASCVPCKLAAAAPSRHHLPGGWFLKSDGFGARGNTAQSKPQSWNRSAPPLQALYPLQRPHHCIAAMRPM